MNTFEKIEQEIYDSGINLDFVDFKSERIKGLCCGNSIAISKTLSTTAEKACVAAEELEHQKYTVGNIISMSKIANRKQERFSRVSAYNKCIGLLGLANAFKYGCQNRSEAADFLNVTEEFLGEAIECYRQKYGRCVSIDNYVIFFEPYLAVMEKL